VALKTLKPRVQTLRPDRIRTLDIKAGATEMERGRAWMAKRQRVALAHGYRCAACGLVLMPGKLADGRSRWQCDHVIPREQGGSNDESNLQPLCTTPCHEEKSAREAQARSGR
jgi:5-methylcytosine-specific restriction protein A